MAQRAGRRRRRFSISRAVENIHDSIRRNVTYGLGEVSETRLREAAARAQALEFVEALPKGFDEVVGDQGLRLSTGERQRLAFVRVFLRQAELILLDEATSALDAATEARVLDALDAFAPDATRVIVTHRLASLRPDDRVVVLHGGRVVEEGIRDPLLARGGELAGLQAAAPPASEGPRERPRPASLALGGAPR